MGRRGVGAVREHPWFKGFNWDALSEGRLKAPHVPKLRDADDMRFFADCEDEQPGAEYSAYTSVGNFSDFYNNDARPQGSPPGRADGAARVVG